MGVIILHPRKQVFILVGLPTGVILFSDKNGVAI